jgi:hypothetical protein
MKQSVLKSNSNVLFADPHHRDPFYPLSALDASQCKGFDVVDPRLFSPSIRVVWVDVETNYVFRFNFYLDHNLAFVRAPVLAEFFVNQPDTMEFSAFFWSSPIDLTPAAAGGGMLAPRPVLGDVWNTHGFAALGTFSAGALAGR